MQAFDIHEEIVQEYTDYLKSFIHIRNPRIAAEVEAAFAERRFLPDGLIQFNPSFALGASLEDLRQEGLIEQELCSILGSYRLYHHQVEAVRKGLAGQSFVVTSGTGSGKSLTYLATIFNSILREGPKAGLQAIVVYPMNALINSQEEEIKKYELHFLKAHTHQAQWPDLESVKGLDEKLVLMRKATQIRFPLTYGKYTGQEQAVQREAYAIEQPNILLTNYMMLELIMTRNSEQWLRDNMREGLNYLVFDELHTYRGRQGADVSMLIRRIKGLCNRKLVCIGTSATMASGKSATERKQAVAMVASQIFSESFDVQQVVEEKLTTCTQWGGTLPSRFDLQEAMGRRIRTKDGSEAFIRNPLAIWLENKVALAWGEDGHLGRGKPKTLREIGTMLSADSSESLPKCEEMIKQLLKWSEELNLAGALQTPRFAFLPFKVHQFISQTGNVYVTLEPKDKRIITLETERYTTQGGVERTLYPVLFSRGSGYDFICVHKRRDKLLPRDPDDLPDRILKGDLKGDRELKLPRRELTEADFPAGYLVLPEEGEICWQESDVELLPEAWFTTRKDERKLDNYYEHAIPHKLYFDAEGNFSKEPKHPYWGWFIPARLLLDPTSGMIYDGRTKEHNKLMRLGNEGRSTATTIMSFSVIKALHRHHIPVQNQKLLSFTDNRQDASLQAGHFNDFLMVARLRAAVYLALKEAPDQCLDIDTLPTRVLKKLALPEEEYAREPNADPTWPDAANEKALKDYITLRLLYDLKRGWRYNTPNLEQCALLEIAYEGLDQLCSMEDAFKDIPLFDRLPSAMRQQYLIQILNFFRTSYAFQFHKLEGSDLEDVVERIQNKLDPDKLWSLDKDEKVDSPTLLVARSIGKLKGKVYTTSIGPLSSLAKYLRRIFIANECTPLKGEAHITYIEQLCKCLTRPKILKEIPLKGDKGEAMGYRLMVDKVIWKLGDGENVLTDEVRTTSLKPSNMQPNFFFRSLYQQDFAAYQRSLVGREHTGQLDNADRIKREDSFRKGEIAALYCSPTMELGIDIHELSIVHMRNVPPTPANYAQRSGRAGRSGQAALVFTYCSNGSAHDRNYFKHSIKMVSGTVVPPKIDLTNEELIRTHFDAFMLMEVGLRDLSTSATDVLEVAEMPAIPLKAELRLYLEEQIKAFGVQWIAQFKAVLLPIAALQSTPWFTDEWLHEQVRSFTMRLDRSFDRWRKMYLTANGMVEGARLVLDDPTIKQEALRKQEARRDHAIGMRRRDILLNKSSQDYGNHSEFYVYRYLAAEGFLPGYGFTRLPIRTFLGYRHLNQGEFISRPRFIALQEFGPRNLIYHNGGKYEINKMQRQRGDDSLHSLKISTQTGYAFLDADGTGINNDPITHAELKGQDMVGYDNSLLAMEESDARPKERISCEEEERKKTGYLIDQYFAFGKGIHPTCKVALQDGDEPLMRLIYDQAAQLIQVNRGWKISRKKEGFAIGASSGKWKMAKELANPPEDDPTQIVHLYTTDTSDILYLQPAKELGLDEAGVTSLAFALKRAVERLFQVEEREIMVWVMGNGPQRNILIYEAAEGSLGILSQLIENGQTLRQLFVEAYKVIHYDPESHEDTEPNLPRATYDDLLSYFNQRHHEILDRHAIKDALRRLMACKLDHQQGHHNRDSQYQYLLDNYDRNSSAERKFIDFLYQGGYAMPDLAQVDLEDCYVNADFVYKTLAGYSIVFCDGSVHDQATVQADDLLKRNCARDKHDVIEWHHSESLEQLVERRKDIFRKVR